MKLTWIVLLLVGAPCVSTAATASPPPRLSASLSAPLYEEIFSLGAPSSGYGPEASLLLGADGALYGTTEHGGNPLVYPNGGGTIFRVDTDGSHFTVLREIGGVIGSGLRGPLVQGPDNAIYGISGERAFRMNADGSDPTALHVWGCCTEVGHNPEDMIRGADGYFYGTMGNGGLHDMGTVFRMSLDGSEYNDIANFDLTVTGISAPSGVMQASDGFLYGATSIGGQSPGGGGYGTIFKVGVDGSELAVLHRFDTFGQITGKLTEGPDGFLYGVFNGPAGSGFIFRLGRDGTGYSVIKQLDEASPVIYVSNFAQLMVGRDGSLYAMGSSLENVGHLFRLNTDGTGFAVLADLDPTTDGYGPFSTLTEGPDGSLYTVASAGGRGSSGGIQCGTVVKFSAGDWHVSVLKTFAAGNDPTVQGADIAGRLLLGAGGALYGTAYQGGAYMSGTVFRVNPDGTGFAVLKHLDNATTGGSPHSGLIQDSNGVLYGTAEAGGEHGVGTIFRLDADGSGFAVLKHLDPVATGGYPQAELLLGGDGALYGTALESIYRIGRDGQGFTVLRHLSWSTDGVAPSGLMQGVDGRLYGTAADGGPENGGTLFAMNPNGTGFVILKAFSPVDGAVDGIQPVGGVVQGADGMLYGTTRRGGALSDYGQAFRIAPDGTGFHALHTFDYTLGGALPSAGLVQAGNGMLYGTMGGGNLGGLVYEVSPNGEYFSMLTYLPNEYASDQSGLALGTDGNLYGGTPIGGAFGLGTCFRIRPEDSSPPVAAITGPSSGSVFPVNTDVAFTGSWNDPDGGQHYAVWAFDGLAGDSLSAGVGTSGVVSTTHRFTSAGVYMARLRVTDISGKTSVASQVDGLDAMVVIYDPSAGFVTGGGWITSPLGAYRPDSSLTGKANFGFVSKYEKGATVPTGQTEFQFKAGNMNFSSTRYDWLVVSGARAQYRGTGRINNAGDYSFTLTCVDGDLLGTGKSDLLRMKITNRSSGGLVYDNMLSASDSETPTTVLGGGTIVIHPGTKSPGGPAQALPAANDDPRVASLPLRYELGRNHPNPFGHTSALEFALPTRSEVRIDLYDLAGREVRSIASGEWSAGWHTVTLSRTAADGSSLRGGIYFLRMSGRSLDEEKRFSSLGKVIVLQ